MEETGKIEEKYDHLRFGAVLQSQNLVLAAQSFLTPIAFVAEKKSQSK